MKHWFVGGCVATLAFLTFVNAWWQHAFYSSQLVILEHEREALAKQLASHRQDLSAQRIGLDNCRSELRDAKEQLHRASRNRGDLSRHWNAETAELKAERDGLASDLRACQDRALDLGAPAAKVPSRARQPRGGGPANGPAGGRTTAVAANPQDTAACPRRLESAIRELRRLRNAAHERALDAQAATARLAVGGQAVAARVRAMQAALAKHVAGLEKRIGAAVDMHAEHLAQMATDIGYKAKPSEFHRMTLQKLDDWVKVAEKGQGNERRQKSPGHKRHNLRSSLLGEAFGRGPQAGREAGPATDSGRAEAEPQTCVASIVPFRGRGEHLALFYRHMAKFLERPEAKRLCWHFYIIEQYDTDLFNRGWLFNVGFAMAQLEPKKFSCLVIQDLDTLPDLGSAVDFGNCNVPTQLSSEIECYGWLPPYAFNAGGVVTMSGDHWHTINGFANTYEGWGGEDDDLRLRLKQLNLLRGTCGSFCNLTDRAFRPGQINLIRRPERGRGRFICLDEKSHTPRKHGDMGSMHKKLKEMEMGSDRWAFDGLSSLHFDLVQHQTRTFPEASPGTVLHWVKAVPSLNLRFGPERVQLLLADGACSPACAAAGRCAAQPSQLPMSITDLQLEVARAFCDCLATAISMDPQASAASLGYWLIDRRTVVTSLRGTGSASVGSGGAGAPGSAAATAATSWVLSETLREALSSPVNGDPALVIRAVPIPQLDAALSRLRSDPLRQEQPLVSACVGIYRLDDYRLGAKHTVNVGSDDCEQRSWTHLASFKVLRHRRYPEDTPFCIGEADDVWTARIGAGLEDCAGQNLGVTWRHKALFYIGKEAQGKEMCVRYRKEKGRNARWSRWQVIPKENGECGSKHDKYVTTMTFRSMEDVYKPPRIYLCATAGEGNKLELELECEPGSSLAFAVLRAELARDEGEVYCIGQSLRGDRIGKGWSCDSTEDEGGWKHVAEFAVPANATGPPWCLGRRLASAGHRASGGVLEHFRVAPQLQCAGHGYEHALSFREVALAELTQEHGLLSLRSM